MPGIARITEAGLKAVGELKYKSSAPTLVDKVCYIIWWNPVAAVLPAWLAPNLLTIMGWASVLCAQLLMLWASPDFKQDVPYWINVVVALLWLFYMTCDAVDGMQARKTGATSPLGQVLDHLCDSLAILVGPLTCCVTYRSGLGLFTFTVVFLTTTPWILSQWTSYFTHVSQVAGATEGELIVVMFHVVTCIFGRDVWNGKIELPVLEITVDAVHLVIVGGCVVAAAASIFILRDVLKALSTTGERMSALELIAPYPALVGIVLAWVCVLPGVYPMTLLMVVACIFTRMAAGIIIGDVTRGGVSAYKLGTSPVMALPVLLFLGVQQLLDGQIGKVLMAMYFAYCFLDACFFTLDSLKQIIDDRKLSLLRIPPKA